MKKRFNSKVDLVFEIIFLGTLALPLVLLFVSDPSSDKWIAQLICVASAALLVWIRYGTYYTITDKELIYKCGPFGGKVKIEKIYKIQKNTNDLYNSGNLSSDKVSIRAKRHGSINISPERKEEFIATLVERNPNIEVIE